MTIYSITFFQKRWLNSRGGRTEEDVLQDEKGLYILMGDGTGGQQKVYLPTNENESL